MSVEIYTPGLGVVLPPSTAVDPDDRSGGGGGGRLWRDFVFDELKWRRRFRRFPRKRASGGHGQARRRGAATRRRGRHVVWAGKDFALARRCGAAPRARHVRQRQLCKKRRTERKAKLRGAGLTPGVLTSCFGVSGRARSGSLARRGAEESPSFAVWTSAAGRSAKPRRAWRGPSSRPSIAAAHINECVDKF